MKNHKIAAFTLAEVLITLFIISVIALVYIKSVKNDGIKEKEYIAKAHKAIETVNYAISQTCESDAVSCPVGTYIVQNRIARTGTTKYAYEYVFSAANSTDAFNIFKNYIKFEQTDLNFCTYSGYCDASSKNYPAGKISGDIYVGINKYDAIANCPNFYTPEGDLITVRAELKTGEYPKCWGNLLVDVNGADGPNTEGNDIFVYGLAANGVFR